MGLNLDFLQQDGSRRRNPAWLIKLEARELSGAWWPSAAASTGQAQRCTMQNMTHLRGRPSAARRAAAGASAAAAAAAAAHWLHSCCGARPAYTSSPCARMKMLTETRCQGGANLAIMSASHIGVHHDRFAGTAR